MIPAPQLGYHFFFLFVEVCLRASMEDFYMHDFPHFFESLSLPLLLDPLLTLISLPMP